MILCSYDNKEGSLVEIETTSRRRSICSTGRRRNENSERDG